MSKYLLHIKTIYTKGTMPEGLSHDIIKGAYYGDLDEVRAAVREFPGAIHLQDEWSGATALHVAASLGNYSIAEFLLGCEGIDPEAKDHKGQDALDRAFYSGHTELFKLVGSFIYPHEMPDDDPPASSNVMEFKPR